MNEALDRLILAAARLIETGADALQSYTKLQEKKTEYFENAAKQATPQAEPSFEQFQPGFFERTHFPHKSPDRGDE